MKIISNIALKKKGITMLADLCYKERNNGKALVFCHGFKGFKDWGAWNLVAQSFAEAGFIFIKFNFSHNGIGQEHLQEFTQLDLFEQNTYSLEIEDLNFVLHQLEVLDLFRALNIQEVNLLGHSRGGGIALLGALENEQVAKVITWASIANFDRFGSEEILAAWKKSGTRSYYNERTKQDMKIAYGFYEDYIQNKDRLNLEFVAKNLKKPLLIIHGTADEAVGFSSAQRLKNWKPDAELVLIEGANHVFGTRHPFKGSELPKHLYFVIQNTISWMCMD